jgi:hypothetical protein
MQEIIITIDKDKGDIEMEAVDYQGIKCKIDMDEIAEKIGLKTISEELKPEYARIVPVRTAKR